MATKKQIPETKIIKTSLFVAMPAGFRKVWRLGSFGFLFMVYQRVFELMGCRGAGKGWL
jgi:hypothetical protein